MPGGLGLWGAEQTNHVEQRLEVNCVLAVRSPRNRGSLALGTGS